MKKNRSFFLLVLLTCLLLISLLVGPLVISRAKQWQAQRHYDQAKLLAEAGDIGSAIQRAEASYRLQPENAAALMFLARLTLRAPEGHPRMNEWWEEAMRTEDCRTEDILLYLEKLLSQRDLARAYPLVVSLRQLEPGNERAANLHADLLLTERKYPEAERVLRTYIAQHGPVRAETSQKLAEILLGFPNAEKRREARSILLSLAQTEGEPQLYALRRITRDAMFTSAERADAGEQLLARDDITIADHLTAYNALLEDRRMRRTAIRDELIKLLEEEAADDPDAIARLGSWLINSDQSRYFLQLLTLEEARLDPNIYAARLLAMVRVGEAEEVYGLTFQQDDRNPLSPIENLLVRAEALAALEREEEFQATLRALADSANSSNFSVVERRLLSYGAYDVLVEAYERLREEPATRAMARRKLLRAYYFLGRERDLLTLLEDFDGYIAEEDPPTQALLCYLNALYGREEDESIEVAEGLVTRYPNIADFRIVLGFQSLRRGERERAMALAENLPSLSERSLRYLQVASTVLRAAADTTAEPVLAGRAGELLEQDLLPTERALLRSI